MRKAMNRMSICSGLVLNVAEPFPGCASVYWYASFPTVRKQRFLAGHDGSARVGRNQFWVRTPVTALRTVTVQSGASPYHCSPWDESPHQFV
jgi:hypothetical protein